MLSHGRAVVAWADASDRPVTPPFDGVGSLPAEALEQPMETGFARAVGEELGFDAVVIVAPDASGQPQRVACWPSEGDAGWPGGREGLERVMASTDPLVTLATGKAASIHGARVVRDGAPVAALLGMTARRRDLDGEERRVLAAFARAAGSVVEGIDQRGRAQRSLERAEELVAAGMTIGSDLELTDVLRRLADTACRVIGARYAALGVLNEDRTALSDFLFSGISEEEARAIGPLPQGRGLLGALIRDARPLRIARIHEDARSVGFPPNHPPMESFLGVPVSLRDEVVGNLYLTEKDGGFTEDDERVALTLAAQAATAVDNARRYAEERRRVAELESVQEVGEALLRTLDLGSLLPLVVARARQLTGAEVAVVGLVDDGVLRVRFAEGRGAASIEGLELGLVHDGVATALQVATGVAHCEVAWLMLGGQRIGMLAVCGHRTFDEGDRRLLATFASEAAIAVANAQTFADARRRLLESAEVTAATERERASAEGLRRAISAQEAERARIARELHDEAGQVLTALALQLRAIEGQMSDEAGRKRLAELRAAVNSATAGLLDLATELRPSGLREHGLEAAIRRHSDRMQETTGIAVGCVLDPLPEELPQEVEIALFRVIQEALTNVARHSGAGQASVLATVRKGRLRVVVEDDGRGFDPGQPSGRLGIAGMRERMDLIGGRLRIESEPGSGTAVIVDLEVS